MKCNYYLIRGGSKGKEGNMANSKLFLLITLVTIVLLSAYLNTKAEGADWKAVWENEVTFFFYDVDSYPSEGIVRVSVKSVPKDINRAIEFKEKLYGVFYKNFAFTIFLGDIRCRDRKNLLISDTDYDIQGNILHSNILKKYPGMEEWKDIPPNSAILGVFNKVCR